MSCIASSGERFNIFRNRSFTLFRDERYFGERSDSVAVAESMSMSMTNFLDTGLTVRVPDISPEFLTWEDHLSSMFHAEEFDEQASITGLSVPVCCTFNELSGTIWLSDLVFTGFSDAIEASTIWSLTRHLDTKFIIGFDFAVTLSSPASSCVLLDIALTLLMERKWLMLNKHKRRFHSSRVQFHLVSMSASWFLVSIYIYIYIWFESWDPNWFYQATNQEQLCGFWKHVSL